MVTTSWIRMGAPGWTFDDFKHNTDSLKGTDIYFPDVTKKSDVSEHLRCQIMDATVNLR